MSNQDVKIREILVSAFPPENEYVKIHNSGAENVDLTGWVLQDSRTHPEHPYIFRFPHTVLNPNDDVIVYSRSGTNDGNRLFWGLDKPVWNNRGDAAVLKDATGQVIDRMEWTEKPPAGMVFDTTEIAGDIARHAQSIGFGAPTGPVKWESGGPGGPLFWQEFGQRGAIFHSGYPSSAMPEKLVHEVPNVILIKYRDLGGPKVLGMPMTGVRQVPGRAASFVDFAKGSIYFSEETGVHAVSGAILDKWRSPEVGGHSGRFGLPVDDERIDTSGGAHLRYLDFEDGTIWVAGESVRAIQGIRIDFVGFHCFGEDSDPFEGASDEVYFIVEAEPLQRPARPNQVNDSKWVTMLPVTGVAYENVDAGETFPDSVTVFWGRPAPLRLRVTGFEHDFGDPNALRDQIQVAIAAIGAAASFAFPVASAIILNPQIQQAVANTINHVIDSGDNIIQSGVWDIPNRRRLLEIIDGETQTEFGLQWHYRIMMDNDGSPQDQAYFRITVTE
ncbi:lamin tail domain-containing protein [Paenibacillus faecalis]|uniref:lamin tail domain-containing protein n=1 Tax=Paenibacillus faecalis TaxID=2079532 RepID=UPI000D0E716C|nr:lamin tail domain-containing protein [Paenibacillus faecalis]